MAQIPVKATFAFKFNVMESPFDTNDKDFKMNEVYKFTQLLHTIFDPRNIKVRKPKIQEVHTVKCDDLHSEHLYEAKVQILGVVETPFERHALCLLLDGLCGFASGNYLYGVVLFEE